MFKHLHIVACSPRSGTTLLHEAMVTCFKVDKHYDHEVRFNQVTAGDGEIVVTKRPKDILYMPAVISDPELFVCYVMRDPRDVIVSRHGKDKGMYYSNIRLWRELHGRAKTIASHERFLQVNYEEFVSKPDIVQSKIARKFPWLERLYDFSDYHLHANVSAKSRLAMNEVRPIAPTSVGKWKKNLPRVKAQQLTHGSLTPDLVECGYETSGEWEQVLQGVEPDFSRSRYPEKVYFWTRISKRIDALRKVAVYRRMRRST
jgi:hypothetical protein